METKMWKVASLFMAGLVLLASLGARHPAAASDVYQEWYYEDGKLKWRWIRLNDMPYAGRLLPGMIPSLIAPGARAAGVIDHDSRIAAAERAVSEARKRLEGPFIGDDADKKVKEALEALKKARKALEDLKKKTPAPKKK